MPLNLNDKLSEHFTVGEFISTSHANKKTIQGKLIKDSQLEYAEDKIKELKLLCEKILEPIRAHMIKNYNFKSLSINSGIRCPELNAMIGGSVTSQHSHGEACDINCLRNTKISQSLFLDIYEGKVEGLDKNTIGQCILEATCAGGRWVHISINSERYSESRKANGRPPCPEFLVTLTGRSGSYLPVSKDILDKYSKLS